jgi:hypothetical protein
MLFKPQIAANEDGYWGISHHPGVGVDFVDFSVGGRVREKDTYG